MKRRDFLKAVGIATGGALAGGCANEDRSVISELNPPPEGVIPGEPYYVNTTCTECPAGCGIRVKIVDGSPRKLEGLPGHPVNNGALCLRGQSSIARLYSPNRLKTPMRKTGNGGFEDITWEEAYSTIAGAVGKARSQNKKSVFLSGRTTGSLSTLIDTFCNRAHVVRAAEYEVYNYANLRQANQTVFGRSAVPNYTIARADLLVTIGADILQTFGSPVSNAVQLASARENGLKWVHIEPHVSLEGLRADKRLVVAPATETALLGYLFSQMQDGGKDKANHKLTHVASITGLSPVDITSLLDEFRKSRKPLLIAGGVSLGNRSGLETAILAARIQKAQGMVGSTVDFINAADYSRTGTLKNLELLCSQMRSGSVGVLFMSRCDPVSTAPASTRIKENLANVPLKVFLTDSRPTAASGGSEDFSVAGNATAELADILLPLSHSLETWGDYYPRADIRSVIQPALTMRLGAGYDPRPEGDIIIDLMRLLGTTPPASDYKSYVLAKWPGSGTKGFSESISKAGWEHVTVSGTGVDPIGISSSFKPLSETREKPAAPVLVITPSIRFFDGRSAGLLLTNEIPDPLTTITWGPWVSISSSSAKEMGLTDRDVIEIGVEGWSAVLPVRVQPLLPEKVFMVERNSLPMPPPHSDPRTGETITWITGIKARKTGTQIDIPILAGSPSQHGRGIIPNPVHLQDKAQLGQGEHDEAIYKEQEYKDYRWAMAIDLDKCIGCGACVAACYVENNLAIVGKQQHNLGREMSWLRIEPYYNTDGSASFVPMLCQQCGKAPCESVCPVYATYHNPEGLNAQIYNRCVGTRYCSNNCPYKVRRFNWFDYNREKPLDMLVNPEVSVRGRGVMEKCTFCVQRIRAARDQAKDEGRLVEDGEVIPACAQTCPSQAITFGNREDDISRVSKLIESDRMYRIFEHLGTEPAVYYLSNKETNKEQPVIPSSHQEGMERE